MTQKAFWKHKSLDQMSRMEWEQLCDGCGKCCLFKLDDQKDGNIRYTNVCCHLLNTMTCTCKSYWNRHAKVSTCMVLTPQRVSEFQWLPVNCAYRLISEGKELPQWHHLVCGDRNRIHREGRSVLRKVISEEYIHPRQLVEHVTEWD